MELKTTLEAIKVPLAIIIALDILLTLMVLFLGGDFLLIGALLSLLSFLIEALLLGYMGYKMVTSNFSLKRAVFATLIIGVLNGIIVSIYSAMFIRLLTCDIVLKGDYACMSDRGFYDNITHYYDSRFVIDATLGILKFLMPLSAILWGILGVITGLIGGSIARRGKPKEKPATKPGKQK